MQEQDVFSPPPIESICTYFRPWLCNFILPDEMGCWVSLHPLGGAEHNQNLFLLARAGSVCISFSRRY